MEIKSTISKIRNIPSSEKLTEDGTKRKKICIERLFYKCLKIKFIVNFCISTFPNLIKKYVMLFEMKEPSVSLLNDKQIELFKEFLVCFCKPEKFKSLNGKGLVR